MVSSSPANIDKEVVEGFGDEWSTFDQSAVSEKVRQSEFEGYFRPFRWDLVDEKSVGFDMGCGSGRWARMLAPKVGHLHCIDASSKALEVARRTLGDATNTTFHNAGVGDLSLPPASMDFGISLGVLHHVPDTAAAIKACANFLKPGAPLLLYLYYRFDNRPLWYRGIWKVSDVFRRGISSLPFRGRLAVTNVIASLVYWPLARSAAAAERLGANVANIPLAAYRHKQFYSMRTDALDRFGTRLEQRFTRVEITQMMEAAGLEDICFSDQRPFWCACGVRRK